jgi:hypothetical protein
LYNANPSWASGNAKQQKSIATDLLNSYTHWRPRLSNLDLLLVYQSKDRKTGLRDLQVTEDKIYVLDSGNQLHIF